VGAGTLMQDVGLQQRAPHPLGDAAALAQIGVRQKHEELVAAEAGENILRLTRRPDDDRESV
jgi:hypothetical protein